MDSISVKMIYILNLKYYEVKVDTAVTDFSILPGSSVQIIRC